MANVNYIFAPAATSQVFRCKVPLKGTRQIFLVNGVEQFSGKPLSLKVEEGKQSEEILQVIAVRNHLSKPIVAPCPKIATSTPSLYSEPLSFENNILFEKNSSGKLLLCSHTFSQDRFITNEVINIVLKEGSFADIALMQNEHNEAVHNSSFNITLEGDARLNMVFLSLHGGSITNNISISLNGKNASCDISGLYLMDGKQVIDNNISLIHKSPSCKSNQLFKGIVDDLATARFYGLINVVPDTQKSEAFQANHNLLISKDAKVYSQPQLEIYADDVICSHGATTGRLDEDELFYMRSRGIPFSEAKLLQQLAFTFSVLEKISNPDLKERMLDLVEKRLRGEFSDCRNCSKNCC